MKKIIILIISLLVVAGLGWFAYDLMSNKGTSIKTELIDFAIKDVSKVDKFIISDDSGNSFEVIKKDGRWTDKNGTCIGQEKVEFILDAFKNIEFKGYLNDNDIEHQITRMSAKHIKVEIFEEGSWSKSWYIGSATPDHYGQIMLVDSKEFGKSDIPVIMQIKGIKGIIEPRFYVDPRKWQCTNIFKLEPSEIKTIDVKYIQEPSRSFTVENFGNAFRVSQGNRLLPVMDTSRIFLYINNYKMIHYNIANYVLNDKQVDSLKKSTPFCVLTVEERKGKTTKLRLFRNADGSASSNEFGQPVNYNGETLWCVLPSGEPVKCQYFVFNPLLLGHIYFPMDMSQVNTGNYKVPTPK